jgi:taurine dioxygenase
MPLAIKPLTRTIGAEVTGVDLSKPVDAATRKALYDAWIEHAVLVIRDQHLTPPQFADAARLFGDLMEQQVTKFTLPEHPEVGTISSKDLPLVDGKLKVRGEQYHTDHSNFKEPPKAHDAARGVAAELRRRHPVRRRARRRSTSCPRTSGRSSSSCARCTCTRAARSPRKMAALTPEERAKIPQTVQPLVIRHPESGRSALYINTARMEGIEGMQGDEGFKLIDELYRHATQSKYEYRHKWRAGDMVIWDNRSVMHQANADYDPAEYRFLYRIMLKGAPLQAATA